MGSAPSIIQNRSAAKQLVTYVATTPVSAPASTVTFGTVGPSYSSANVDERSQDVKNCSFFDNYRVRSSVRWLSSESPSSVRPSNEGDKVQNTVQNINCPNASSFPIDILRSNVHSIYMIMGSDKQKFKETDKFKIEKPFPMNKVDVYQILANNNPEYSKLLILDTACQRNVTGDRWLSEQFSLSLSLFGRSGDS